MMSGRRVVCVCISLLVLVSFAFLGATSRESLAKPRPGTVSAQSLAQHMNTSVRIETTTLADSGPVGVHEDLGCTCHHRGPIGHDRTSNATIDSVSVWIHCRRSHSWIMRCSPPGQGWQHCSRIMFRNSSKCRNERFARNMPLASGSFHDVGRHGHYYRLGL